MTGLYDQVPVFPGQTVSPELLSLTVGGSLPQPSEVLRHSDVLDGCQGTVTLSVQSYQHGVCGGIQIELTLI